MKEKQTRILVVRPGQEPKVAWVKEGFRNLQAIVCGRFEFMPFDEQNTDVEVMVNGEYLLLANSSREFCFNRYLRSDYHSVASGKSLPEGVPIFGTFAVVRNDMETGDKVSLTDADVDKYKKVFKLEI